jgi:spermidine synthase
VRTSARPVAVASISGSTLAFELLLVRVFAIEHFHHFAYMAIGVAMLGMGVSGTALALYHRLDRARSIRLLTWSSGFTALCLILAPIGVHLVSLDATQIPWDRAQWLRLAVVYALLALPFAAGSLTVLAGLSTEVDAPGRIYGASFVGSGVGAACGLAVLWFLPPEKALAFPAVLAAFGFVTALSGDESARNTRALAWSAIIAAFATLLWPPWVMKVSPYKALPQVEAYPDASRTFEAGGPLGWTVAVHAAAFRFAPGLSLAYDGLLPPQTALFVDGAIAGAVSNWPEESDRSILDWLPTASPYAISSPGGVLIIGSGGDVEIWNALEHQASEVTVLELNPDLVDAVMSPKLAQAQLEGRVRWRVGDARSYVARTEERYDLITLSPAGGLGTSVAGVHALAEDFLHTSDAYRLYLSRLTDNGILAVTRWLQLPPRESLRVLLTAVEALRSATRRDLAECVIVVRSWGTVTVLVKPAGFGRDEIESLRSWMSDRLFDLDWYPGISSPATEYNYLAEPTLYDAAVAAISRGDRLASFIETYPFSIAPVDDTRPYPHHFVRIGSLRGLLGENRGSWLPFAEWGQVALVATLAQSAVLASLLILLPAAWAGRKRRGSGWTRWIGYFTAIGLAYLAVEIAAIQQLALLLGHPIYAVAVVLTAFLICSGVGSLWSDQLPSAVCIKVCFGLASTLLFLCIFALPLVHRLQPTALPVRALTAAALLAPAACLMGMPFPLGLRSAGGIPRGRVAWAWAANGFASVVAAPLAALLALEFGSPSLFVFGVVGYVAAALLFPRMPPQST